MQAEDGNRFWGRDWADVRALWPLAPDVAHLNHGSFGAPPIPVLAAQERIRRRAAADPVQFFRRDLAPERERARRAVAAFVGADPAGLAFVPNATAGVNAVLRSVSLRPGDEVVLTDHGYGAVRLAAEEACRAAGARIVIASVSLTADPDEIVSTVCGAMSTRTALVVVDEVTSATARRFPVERIVDAVRERGAMTLVDGAHAPGMLPVHLERLGADYWVGNLHKWVCAPHGAGLLYAGPARRASVRSLIVSWDESLGFPHSYGNIGTADQTAWLASPTAIECLGGLGWERLRRHNADLAAYGQRVVADALGADDAALPADPGVSMRIVPLPRLLPATPCDVDRLLTRITDRMAVQVAANVWNGRAYLRLSAHVYNRPADYERLAAGLPELLAALR